MNARKVSMSRQPVAEAIRRLIMDDQLAPGQRLVEADLSRSFGTSRSNVRGALMDLSQEGLVERIAHRGARVRVITLQEALQITEVRMVMEEFLVAKAAEKITASGITTLRSLAKKLEVRAKQGDGTGFAETTHKIREVYVRIADHPVAAEVLARLRALISKHRFRLTYRSGRASVALPFWLERVDAICRRDSAAARLAVQRHAANVNEAMRALASEKNPFVEES
jgi:DNA-binding GntR family transcriptional regulator